jgi:hypothetical protein
VACSGCAILPIGPKGLFRDWYLAYHNATQLAGPWRSFLRVCVEHLPRLFSNEEGRTRKDRSSAKSRAAAPEHQVPRHTGSP